MLLYRVFAIRLQCFNRASRRRCRRPSRCPASRMTLTFPAGRARGRGRAVQSISKRWVGFCGIEVSRRDGFCCDGFGTSSASPICEQRRQGSRRLITMRPTTTSASPPWHTTRGYHRSTTLGRRSQISSAPSEIIDRIAILSLQQPCPCHPRRCPWVFRPHVGVAIGDFHMKNLEDGRLT